MNIINERKTHINPRIINWRLAEKDMGTGILMCGLNGTGESTLGKALAKKLNFYFIDNEDLYFSKTNPEYLYAAPRTRMEVEQLLLDEIAAHENFVFASVKGDYENAIALFQYAILITVPRELRMQRVKNRSYEKFGNRMLPGGDLHDQEERFFEFVKGRGEDSVEEWIKTLNCPVLRVDGTDSVEKNVEFIMERL